MSEDTQLKWGVSGKKIFQLGVDRVALYANHGKGVAWEGVSKVAPAPEGAEASDIYANNMKYATMRSKEKFKFTINAYDAPVEWDECDGSAALSAKGSAIKGVRATGQTRLPFDLTYRTLKANDQKSIDYGYLLHLVYNGSAAPSSSEYSTVNGDAPEPIDFSWECETDPEDIPGLKPASHIIIDSTDADPAALKKLEDILYGVSEAPRMVKPSELVEIFGGTEAAPAKEYRASTDYKANGTFPTNANVSELSPTVEASALHTGDKIKTATSGAQYLLVTNVDVAQKKYTTDKVWH